LKLFGMLLARVFRKANWKWSTFVADVHRSVLIGDTDFLAKFGKASKQERAAF